MTGWSLWGAVRKVIRPPNRGNRDVRGRKGGSGDGGATLRRAVGKTATGSARGVSPPNSPHRFGATGEFGAGLLDGGAEAGAVLLTQAGRVEAVSEMQAVNLTQQFGQTW